MRINLDKFKQKARGLNSKIARTSEEVANKQKVIYPSYQNLDTGNMAIYPTDKPDWFKFVITNKDFPGVALLRIDKVIAELQRVQQKYADKLKENKSADKKL